MVAGWEWDETLFLGTAPYYRRGRPPYAPGLAGVLADVLDLDGRGRLIDVGCGPGTLALSLAHAFRETVGVDPDAGMIAEAERGAAGTGVAGRTRWVRARAEELPPGLGTFTAATFGQSFHWMDQDRVAAIIRDLLLPGGALVHVADLKSADQSVGSVGSVGSVSSVSSVSGVPYPAEPDAAIGALVREYLGPVRRAGRGVLPHGTPGGEAAVFARAGFTGPERHVVPGGQPLERTVDDAVAGVFSMSFSAPHLFGARRDAFEADLRRLLWRASSSGRFSGRVPSTEVRVWRKGPAEPASPASQPS
ncbi:class I SAM-dependent methyltransferase [Streptomyces sp. NPDC059255]|uniref:class I SAM-dependent methyltransferase n=1 Tax=Streptomyces sp. NPDC059255 TaxID=3346793 RepID=UPI003688D626